MKIHHAALRVQDIEGMKAFYVTYLGGTAGTLYHNPKTGLSSYFIRFSEGAMLELMRERGDAVVETHAALGYSHVCYSLGSRKAVDELTVRLKNDGFAVLSGPRQTGDGYYESVILDPEGNRVEISA